MKATVFIAYILLLMYFVVGVAFIYLFVLLVRALRKYIKSEPVRKEKAESAKSLGEVIKRYRTQRKMTQEFVAESLSVSRQAVSKWESEQSTPDIEKIIIMSELFEVTTDYILKGIEPVSMTNKKTMYSLYLGFALIFATIAGIWSFTANRFRIDECFFIVIAGAAIGCAIALVIQVIFNLFRKE